MSETKSTEDALSALARETARLVTPYSSDQEVYAERLKQNTQIIESALSQQAEHIELLRQESDQRHVRIVELKERITQLEGALRNPRACLRCEGHGVCRKYLNIAGDYKKYHCEACNGTGRELLNPEGGKT